MPQGLRKKQCVDPAAKPFNHMGVVQFIHTKALNIKKTFVFVLRVSRTHGIVKISSMRFIVLVQNYWSILSDSF